MAQISSNQSGKSSNGNVTDAAKGTVDKVADAARTQAAKVEDIGRNGLTDMQRRTAATIETQRDVSGQVAQDTKEFGQALSKLFNEQAQHNVEVFTKLTRTFNLTEAAQIQADFLRASMDRSAQFTRRYFEVAQATMLSAMTTGQASPFRR